jgi:hypothetical protein
LTRQFNRNVRVQVAERRYTDLDVAFEIEKALGSHLNKATVKVTNLSEQSRNQIDELSLTRRRGTGRIRVVVEASYGSDPLQVIFSGDLRNGASAETPPGTWVTTLEGEDAGRSFLWSRVNASFEPGATPLQVAQECVNAMGVGRGNLIEALTGARLERGGTTFEAGTVLSGSAPEELRGVLRSCGFTYSVNDNVLQVLRRGNAIQRTAVRLVWNRGLIGSPVKNLDGTVKVNTLLNPDIYPGRQIQVESRTVNGNFRAKKVKYTGDTAGLPWYCEIEAEELTAVAA